LPYFAKKREKPQTDLAASLDFLETLIEPVTPDLYSGLESEARLRLRGRDEEDWPVLAAALALGCSVWTEDSDFFGTGVAVWTTARVEILLKQQVASPHPSDE
jgi:predicted nucleic acid-binding protein